MSRTAIVYFSAGGNTAKAAKAMAAAVGADLYEIRPTIPYTRRDLNWMNPKSRSSLEMHDPQGRPAIEPTGFDPSGFDNILLGFPIWWYVAPTIINTFLEGCGLSGKKVILFATSGSSGFGDTVKRLQPSAPGAELTEGKVFTRLKIGTAADWIRGLSL